MKDDREDKKAIQVTVMSRRDIKDKEENMEKRKAATPTKITKKSLKDKKVGERSKGI